MMKILENTSFCVLKIDKFVSEIVLGYHNDQK